MTRGIHWFRRDLRLTDNAALAALVAEVDELLPVFVVDPRLVEAGDERPRVRFLFDCLGRLRTDLARRGCPLVVRSGRPEDVIPALMAESGARRVSFGTGSTPFAARRDARVRAAVEARGGRTVERLDDGILVGGRLRTRAGGAYRVYTPYRNAWWRLWQGRPALPLPRPRLPAPVLGIASDPVPELDARSRPGPSLPTGGEEAARRRLRTFLEKRAARYHVDRDRPDRDGTSRLSPYLRFGAISPRECFAAGLEARGLDAALRPGVDKWLDEIIWREFYIDLAVAEPRILRASARPEYDRITWDDDPRAFEAWAEGRTGYPIVDAGMRQLRQTGWMHNRVRMLAASFLTKDLLIDWRRGERLFMDRLVDGDPTSNNGGWQWSASTGSDAQPYFRIFNPAAQGERHDPEGRYVRRFVPELRRVPDAFVHAPWRMQRPPADYPAPIVDHAERRREALARYGRVRAPAGGPAPRRTS